MSWSLKLRNGDLSTKGASLDIVTGSEKLVQDLRCFILERMGTDSAHPDFGSLFDGGVQNGLVHESVIGSWDWGMAESIIREDLNRIMKEYSDDQLIRARQDRAVYGRTTFTKGEVLMGIGNISFERSQDILYVTINLTTGDGQDLELDLTLNN